MLRSRDRLNTMNSLESIYTSMWERSVAGFAQGIFDLDHLLNDPGDDRRGVALLARVSGDAAGRIESFLEESRLLEPGQYYYTKRDFHITVLSIISCEAGFELARIDTGAYIDLVAEEVGKISSFDIEFEGITASPSCVLIQGFPVGNHLRALRDRLRRVFKGSRLYQTIDKRYRISTAHCTALRFCEPLRRPDRLVKFLEANRGRSFGRCHIEAVDLVHNDWYARTERIELLKRYELADQQ